MNHRSASALLKLTLSMIIFGTIGIFVRHIPIQSSVIALFRGLIGAGFLLFIMRAAGKTLSAEGVKKNLPRLCLSGAAIGFNWILLFEAYRFTSVATATLCYYLAPIIVMLVSPFVLGERLTLRKALCIFAALVGMLFVSGAASGGLPSAGELRGIAFGLGAACLYAAVVLLNKGFREIESLDRTVVQLGVSAAVLAPYVLLTGDIASLGDLSPASALVLVFVAIVHTGIAYALYFGSIRDLPAQTAALFSYIDPVVAILLSAFLLGEPMTMESAVGAVMILGSAVVSELPVGKTRG